MGSTLPCELYSSGKSTYSLCVWLYFSIIQLKLIAYIRAKLWCINNQEGCMLGYNFKLASKMTSHVKPSDDSSGRSGRNKELDLSLAYFPPFNRVMPGPEMSIRKEG